jgi:hypothetical protein
VYKIVNKYFQIAILIVAIPLLSSLKNTEMMTETVTKNNFVDAVKDLFEEKYAPKEKQGNYDLILKRYIDSFNDDLYFMIEHPYVDKMYRDTYYNYFASKRHDYSRDAIKVSIFSSEVKNNQFTNQKHLDKIQEKYLGFFVLRPTLPQIFGRSVIDPKAFKNNDIMICKVEYDTTANNIKLKVKGFPHSSQDGEVISCAETTIWSIMEYFGNKYPEYTPVLPSKITEIMSHITPNRLIPSVGLYVDQISFALNKMGFGVKTYNNVEYKKTFLQLLRIYVESGMPVVGIIENNEIAHAVNIIGRKKISLDKVEDAIKEGDLYKRFEKRLEELLEENCKNANDFEKEVEELIALDKIYDFADIDLEYVFIDDNYPPYQISKLGKPMNYYTNKKWKGCQITNFIVPLYPKVYLEAEEATKMSMELIIDFRKTGKLKNQEMLFKTFLVSSRSYKNYLSLNKSFDVEKLSLKGYLLDVSMPKFIWVTEISDKENIINDKSIGMLVLDATEPTKIDYIYALIDGHFIKNNNTLKCSFKPFSNYQNLQS